MTEIEKLGRRITTLCETKGISAAELADRCSVTPQMLDEIVAGNYMPPVSVLVRLSRVLGERLGSLLDDQSVTGPVIRRSDESSTPIGVTDKSRPLHDTMDVFPLASGKAGRHMEPFMITLPAGDAAGSKTSTHEGEEFIFVLEGRIGIVYGKETFELSAGDSIYYDSIVSHAVFARGFEAARILAVVYTPA